MKKLISLFLLLALSLSVCLLLTSCGKGKDGKDGADGKTPYIGENGNWWIGETDTGVKAEGTDGKNGVDGTPGADGKTPYIGENGNWWIGEIDTGVKAEGTVSKPNEEPAAPSEDLTGITVKKTSSHDRIRTVHPGDEVTYTFTVTNAAEEAKVLSITDVIPTLTTYASGDAAVNGSALTLNITAPAGETVTASYTVKVTEDSEKLGTAITSDSAELAGNKIPCADLYIGKTFNEYDMAKLVTALYAMRESEMKGKDILIFHYRIAFSLICPIEEDAADVVKALFLDATLENSATYASMVIPGLYGGTALDASVAERLVGDATATLEIEDIFPGDVLLILPSVEAADGAKMYITDGARLFDVTGKTTEVSVASVLNGIADNDCFALLRPCLTFTESFFRSQPFYEGETDIERAIIAVANAFMLRGDRAQYGDTNLAPNIRRWERNKLPEDYTIGEIGYTNCTGFTHDVYYTAFGWDYGNFSLYNAPSAMIAYQKALTGKETEAEKAAIEAEYRAILQVGDIIYYRYSGNNHGLIYLGNGNMMHCTGSVYSNFEEIEEASIRYLLLDTLFTPGNSRYFFQTDNPRTNIYIIRPLNSFTGEIPEDTYNRIENMQGVVAEKLASHTLGQTVNPGDLITYTFKIFNANGHSVTVNVADLVPEGTTLIVDGVVSAEKVLSWTVTIAPGEEECVSYTVKVSETAENGSAILCSEESTVGGIPVRITPIFVGKTLTSEEQAALKDAVAALIGGSDTSIKLANKIYKEVLGVDNILGESMSALRAGIFLSNGDLKKIAEEGNYAALIAPTLYGGQTVSNSERFLGERTRMPWERNLIVGDILYLQSSTSGYLYIYVGDGAFIDLQTFKTRKAYERCTDSLGWKEFCVLRPSLALGE